MKHIISLPAINRQVTCGQYVHAVKLAMDNPAEMFKHGFSTRGPTDGEEIYRQFRKMVADHCNRGLTIYNSWKWNKKRLNKAKQAAHCRNCKQPLPETAQFNPNNRESRFCSLQCRKDYWL